MRSSCWFWGQQLIVTPDAFYAATGRELFAVKREAYAAASLRRKGLLDRQRDLNTQIQRAKARPGSGSSRHCRRNWTR